VRFYRREKFGEIVGNGAMVNRLARVEFNWHVDWARGFAVDGFDGRPKFLAVGQTWVEAAYKVTPFLGFEAVKQLADFHV